MVADRNQGMSPISAPVEVFGYPIGQILRDAEIDFRVNSVAAGVHHHVNPGVIERLGKLDVIERFTRHEGASERGLFQLEQDWSICVGRLAGDSDGQRIVLRRHGISP